MKTLARFTVVVGIAVGMTACLAPKEMPASNLTPEHAKWIADVTPILGTWLGGIENEHGWVDALRAGGGVLILAGSTRDPDWSMDVSTLRMRGSPWLGSSTMDGGRAAQDAAERSTVEAERRLARTRALVAGCGSPWDGVFDIRVIFQKPGERHEYEGSIIIDGTLVQARPTRADLSGAE